MRGFLKSLSSAVAQMKWTLVLLNWLFFGFIVIGSVVVQAGFVEVVPWPFGSILPVQQSNILFTIAFIFVFNLVLSGFLLVTLSGLMFFGLSVFFLCFRAFLWGVLISGLTTPMFLFVLPTLILEGEGYVLAGYAGVNLGLSWLKPNWVFKEEKDKLSRSEALKRASRNSALIYVLVAIILFVAAIVETATLMLISV